ncbi:MAG: ATP-binding protein [Alphaproteobacteria bacterium]
MGMGIARVVPLTDMGTLGRTSIRTLALALTVMIIVPLCVGLWLALSASLDRLATQNLDAQLVDEADHLLALMDEGASNAVVPPPLGGYQEIFSGRYWQVNRAGKITRSRSSWDFALPEPGTSFADIEGPAGQVLRAHRRETDDGAALLVAFDRAPTDAMIAATIENVLVALAILSVAVLLAVFAVVIVLTRPLHRAAAQAHAMTRGERAALSEDVPAELLPLVQSLNRNVEAREKVLARTRLQAANLAHALKTPLAVLQARANADDLPQLENMSHEINRALRRARIGGGVVGAQTPVRSVAEDLSRVLSRLFESRNIVFDCSQIGTATLPIDEDDLHDLLGNLMENAAKWARAQIRVSVCDGKLLVEDDGPGIPAQESDRVLNAGVRLDEQTPGSGLGLALVADIAAAYDTHLAIDKSDLGGACITIAFQRPS